VQANPIQMMWHEGVQMLLPTGAAQLQERKLAMLTSPSSSCATPQHNNAQSGAAAATCFSAGEW
jgi:hypothetical protein